MIRSGGPRRGTAERKPGYLGDPADSRFPSTRRLRSVLAALIDFTVLCAVAAGVTWAQVVLGGPSQAPLAYIAVPVVAFVMFFLLPSWVGGSPGQVVCGLAVIRCRDAGRARVRDTGRAIARHRGSPFRIRGIHSLAPYLVVVRRRDLVAYRAAMEPSADDSPAGPPEYHGAEGDPRYPSDRDRRKLISSVIDFVAIMVVTPLVGAGVASLAGGGFEIGAGIAFWTLMPLQLVALPASTGATLGQHLCGLAQIRGVDGAPPTVRDLLGAGDSVPPEIRQRGDLYVTLTGLVVVRRRDLAAPVPTAR